MTDTINPHNGPFEPYTPTPQIDAFNALLRPSVIYALAFCAVVFVLGLGMIMLYRYAIHGEIDWQGLAAFITLVLFPIGQHFQNRHQLRMAGRA